MSDLRGVKIICLGPKEGFAPIRRLVENHGGEVWVVRTLTELERCEERSASDLVLLWLFRDTRDWLKALPVLKRNRQGVPVIVVTDRMNLDLYLNALALGAFDALSVPTDERELLRIVSKALGQSSDCVLSALA